MSNNNHSPKLSIIVPVFNTEKYLTKCIDSILCQTFDDFELILINDGSKDNSLAILKEYEQKDKRIKVFDKINSGVSDTRNFGINKAKGKWLCFIDSDDWIEPNYLSEFFKAPIDTDTIVSQGVLFDYENSSITKPFFQYYNAIIDRFSPKLIAKYRVLHNGCPVCKLFNRDILNQNNIRFDTCLSIHEDHCFVFDYLQHMDKIILSKSLSYHYMIRNTPSLTTIRHSSEEWLYASESLIDRLSGLSKRWGTSLKYQKDVISEYGIRQLYSAALNSCPKNFKNVYSILRNKKKLLFSYKEKSFFFKILFISVLSLHLDTLLYRLIAKR